MRIVISDWARAGLAKAAVSASVPAEAVVRNWRRETGFKASLLGAGAPSVLALRIGTDRDDRARRRSMAGRVTLWQPDRIVRLPSSPRGLKAAGTTRTGERSSRAFGNLLRAGGVICVRL